MLAKVACPNARHNNTNKIGSSHSLFWPYSGLGSIDLRGHNVDIQDPHNITLCIPIRVSAKLIVVVIAFPSGLRMQSCCIFASPSAWSGREFDSGSRAHQHHLDMGPPRGSQWNTVGVYCELASWQRSCIHDCQLWVAISSMQYCLSTLDSLGQFLMV